MLLLVLYEDVHSMFLRKYNFKFFLRRNIECCKMYSPLPTVPAVGCRHYDKPMAVSCTYP